MPRAKSLVAEMKNEQNWSVKEKRPYRRGDWSGKYVGWKMEEEEQDEEYCEVQMKVGRKKQGERKEDIRALEL